MSWSSGNLTHHPLVEPRGPTHKPDPPPTGGASRVHLQTWPTTHEWSLAGPLANLTHHPRVEPLGSTREPDPPTTHGWSLADPLAKTVRICHYRYSIKRWISSFKLLRVCMWGVGVYCTIGRVCVLACVLSNLTWLTLIGGGRKSYGESRRVEGGGRKYILWPSDILYF